MFHLLSFLDHNKFNKSCGLLSWAICEEGAPLNCIEHRQNSRKGSVILLALLPGDRLLWYDSTRLMYFPQHQKFQLQAYQEPFHELVGTYGDFILRCWVFQTGKYFPNWWLDATLSTKRIYPLPFVVVLPFVNFWIPLIYFASLIWMNFTIF